MIKVIVVATAVAAGIIAPLALARPTKSTAIYTIVDRIAGPDGGWDYANVDSARARLYVARSNATMRVDLASRQVTPALAIAEHGHQILPLPKSNTLLQTNGDSGLVRLIDSETGKVGAEIATGKDPDAGFWDAATRQFVIMNAKDGTVALLDATAHRITGRITIGGGLEFGVPDGKGGAYVNVEDGNAIAAIDLRTQTVTRRIALTGCEGPTGLALVAGGTRLISACANGVAVVVDPKAGKVVTTLSIGRDPDAVLVDPARHLAFIPCGGSGTLVAIDTARADSMRVVATIATQIGAKTGALDTRTGRIYLPTATLLPPEPGAKRGKPVPGTFTILVLAPSR
jgi:DNA-binding beta-propeller fold protein YncE